MVGQLAAPRVPSHIRIESGRSFAIRGVTVPVQAVDRRLQQAFVELNVEPTAQVGYRPSVQDMQFFQIHDPNVIGFQSADQITQFVGIF